MSLLHEPISNPFHGQYLGWQPDRAKKQAICWYGIGLKCLLVNYERKILFYLTFRLVSAEKIWRKCFLQELNHENSMLSRELQTTKERTAGEGQEAPSAEPSGAVHTETSEMQTEKRWDWEQPSSEIQYNVCSLARRPSTMCAAQQGGPVQCVQLSKEAQYNVCSLARRPCTMCAA